MRIDLRNTLQALVGVSLTVFPIGPAMGQTTGDKPSFEVASIKPAAKGTLMELARSGKFRSNIDDARIDLAGWALVDYIAMAYAIPADRISGPAWMTSERFDIQAKLPAGASKDQVPAMLESLLKERFKLALHNDPKVTPVYALVVGSKGPKLTESSPEDAGPSGCNSVGGRAAGGRPGHHVCHKTSMAQLADLMTGMARMNAAGLDMPVVDQTGLKGVYDFDLDYGRVGGGGRRGDPDASANAGEVTEISLIDAVKTIGLQLERRKLPFDYLLIDHVERSPLEN